MCFYSTFACFPHLITNCSSGVQIMAHERGSVAVALVLLACSLMLNCHRAHAAVTYTVGDAAGWSFNVSGWGAGKRFKVGDVLVFKYNPKLHNLVVEDTIGYDTCTVSSSAKIYQTGNESIELVKVGPFDFISNLNRDCDNGMKLEVIVQPLDT